MSELKVGHSQGSSGSQHRIHLERGGPFSGLHFRKITLQKASTPAPGELFSVAYMFHMVFLALHRHYLSFSSKRNDSEKEKRGNILFREGDSWPSHLAPGLGI